MPDIFVIGGPNGAGKSTTAMKLLPEGFQCREFVNADSIAAGLSPFDPESVALEAGRLMLERIHRLADSGQDFAFETTMAARSFAPFLRRCKESGYRVHLLFLWLPDVELALSRVRGRVARGGHNVPEDVVRRRYSRGLKNMFELYIPLAEMWMMVDSSELEPRLIARQTVGEQPVIVDPAAWRAIGEMRS